MVRIVAVIAFIGSMYTSLHAEETIVGDDQKWMRQVATCCLNEISVKSDGNDSSNPVTCSTKGSSTFAAAALASPQPNPSPTFEKDQSKADQYARCICESFKNKPNKKIGQLNEYCASFDLASRGQEMEYTLIAVDAATAASCWAACYNPAMSTACNCAAFAEGALDFANQMILFQEAQKYHTQIKAMDILTGPILGGMGVVSGGPGCW